MRHVFTLIAPILASVPVTATSASLRSPTHGQPLVKHLLALIVLHAAGALQRHFIHHDRTLRRMLAG